MKVGFIGIPIIVFITLKLTHQIDWSWFWVFSPIIISGMVAVTLIVIIGSVSLICDK